MAQGHCDPRFDALRQLFTDRLTTGDELGASISVSIDGQTAVDLWGGSSTPAGNPWTSDTIAPVWSISKSITALAVLLLIDRGQLHPEDPVAKHWPAFNTDDKRSILVRHILGHTAGLPSWDPPISASELLTNTPAATEKILAQKPWWEPGTASGYHLITQGLLLGELVRRVSGKSLPEFVAEKLAIPLDADFHLGLQDETEWGRLAEMKPPPPLELPANLDSDSIMLRALRGTHIEAQTSSTVEFRRAGIGSIGGFSNARGMNKILSLLTRRGLSADGKQLLRPSTVDLIFEPQAEGPDLVLGRPLKMGMGFGLANGSIDWIPSGRVCFWGGWGGSLAVMDLDRGVTFTYAMNRMENGTLGNANAEAYFRAVYGVLDG
ncbi:beta-lactamase/transpeptidase-like protein [Aspergillus aurantiobrunneus]